MRLGFASADRKTLAQLPSNIRLLHPVEIVVACHHYGVGKHLPFPSGENPIILLVMCRTVDEFNWGALTNN
jgi:hypothetical protein